MKSKAWFRNFIVAALFCVLAVSAGIAGMAFADGGSEKQTDLDWATVVNSVNKIDETKGMTEISNLNAWGARSRYTYKVKLDGLRFTLETSAGSGDCVGVILGATTDDYFGSGNSISLTIWKTLYSGQTRMNVGANHDPNGASIVHTTQEDLTTNRGFGVAGSMVINDGATIGITFAFDKVDNDWYKLTLSMTASTMWATNANYNANGGGEGIPACHVYLPATALGNMLDSNDECNLIAAGFPSGTNPADTIYMNIDDANLRAYNAAERAAAVSALGEYETAVAAITDATTFETAMTARTALGNAVSALRNNDRRAYQALTETADSGVVGNAFAQSAISGIIQTEVDKVTAITTTFATESNITSEAAASAVSAYNAAKTVYDNQKNMMSTANKEAFDTVFAGQLNEISKAKVTLWIMNFESKIEALDPSSDTIGADVAAVKSYRSGFSGSEAETLLNNLATADKTTLQTRLDTADGDFAAAEALAETAVKTEYILQLEAALNEDLTILHNINEAKSKLQSLESNVSITSEDGAIYIRYNTAKATLATACETYVSAQIASVSGELDTKFTTMAAFNTVRAKYKAITLTGFVSEQSSSYTAISAAYNALTQKIQSNIWYNLNQSSKSSTNGVTVMEQNASGIYFEMTPAFPNRINYNKQIDLTSGFEANIEFSQIAYYNGDTKDGGASRGANNICINFLAAPDSYKTYSAGVSIIIWLFEIESNIQVLNANDASFANTTLSTPINGGNLNIKASYGAYYDFVADETYNAYILEFNGNQIVIKPSQMEANNIVMPSDHKVYFSFGTFADDITDKNCFTLKDINGVSFAAKDEPVPTVADKAQLNALIAQVEALTEADYTAASWTALASALTGAKAAAANTNATQAEVDSAYNALNTAKAGLAEISGGSGENKGCKDKASASIAGIAMLLAMVFVTVKKFKS